jgi:hypothetical protein
MRNELELVSEWKRLKGTSKNPLRVALVFRGPLNIGVMGMTLRLSRPVNGVNNFSAWIFVQDK